MSGLPGLTLDALRWFRFPPRIAPTHARCFAQDDPDSGGAAARHVPDGLECSAVGEKLADLAADPRDWKDEYVREVTQSRRYRQRAQKAEADLESLRSRALTPEQHEEYERLRLLSESLADKDRLIQKLQGTVREVVGLNELSKALVACGVGSQSRQGDKMLAQAAALLAGRVQVDLQDGTAAARVLDEQRRPLLGADGELVGIQEFVADWLAEEGSHFLPPSGDTGSGVHKGDPTGGGASIEALDRDPKAKAQFIARHGPQAYVQLARKARG